MIIALLAITVVGAVLRLPFLGNQSLWYDEALTVGVVDGDSPADVWRGVEETEANPPLHYLVVWLFRELAGSGSDAVLRAPGALAAVAAVPVAFFALRRFVDERVALAAAALCATSPILVAYALDARAYSLLVLFALLSIWAAGALLEQPSRRRWLAWALASALALWTHYFAVFLVAAEVALLLWRLPAARRALAAATALVLALTLPLLVLLPEQLDERSEKVSQNPLDERAEQAVRQYVAGPNPPSALLEGAALLIAIGGLAAGLYLGRERLRGYVPLVAFVLAGALLPLLLAVVGIDYFLVRNLLPVWACFAALAAVGLVRARGAPLAAFLAVSVAIVIGVQTDWRHRNADWEGAADTLGERAGSAPLIVQPAFNVSVAGRYLDADEVAGPVMAQETWALVEPGRIDRRDLQALDEYPRRPPPGFEQREVLRHHGFRIVHYVAPRPLPISRDTLGEDVLGDPPALLVRR